MADGEVTVSEIGRRLARVEDDIERLEIQAARHATAIGGVRGSVEHLRKESAKWVTQSDFQPVQRIVYGIVGLILVAVVTALVGLVLKGGAH
jgi:hypothetical protein